jgi:hypothetical protein
MVANAASRLVVGGRCEADKGPHGAEFVAGARLEHVHVGFGSGPRLSAPQRNAACLVAQPGTPTGPRAGLVGIPRSSITRRTGRTLPAFSASSGSRRNREASGPPPRPTTARQVDTTSSQRRSVATGGVEPPTFRFGSKPLVRAGRYPTVPASCSITERDRLSVLNICHHVPPQCGGKVGCRSWVDRYATPSPRSNKAPR